MLTITCTTVSLEHSIKIEFSKKLMGNYYEENFSAIALILHRVVKVNYKKLV